MILAKKNSLYRSLIGEEIRELEKVRAKPERRA